MDPNNDPELDGLRCELAGLVAKIASRMDVLHGGMVTKKSIMDIIVRMISVTASEVSIEPNDDPYPPITIDIHRAISAPGKNIDSDRFRRIASASGMTSPNVLLEALTRGLLSLENEWGLSN